jgi:hypothetical protein
MAGGVLHGYRQETAEPMVRMVEEWLNKGEQGEGSQFLKRLFQCQCYRSFKKCITTIFIIIIIIINITGMKALCTPCLPQDF